MKKFFLGSLIFCFATPSFAQFYLNLGLGYAFPSAGQTIIGNTNGVTPISGSQTNPNSLTTSYPEQYNIKSASFSTGFQGGIGLGYMFSQHVGVQLDAEVGLSSKKYTFVDDNVNTGSSSLIDVSFVQQAKSPFIAIPALVLQTGGNPWNLYTRMGLALPISTKMVQDQIVTSGAGTSGYEIDDYTLDIKNSFSLGFAAAAGVKYNLNDHVSIWGEVSLLSLSVYIKQSVLEGVSVTTAQGNQTYPASAVSGPTVTNYSKKVSADSAGTEQPAFSQPFSNVAINFGVTFRFGNSNRSSGRRNNDDIDSSKPFRRHD